MAKEYVNKSGYRSREVEASNSVLLELIHIMGEFHGSMVLVGGGAPPFLLPHVASQYVGTMDIDLALNINDEPEGTYVRFRDTLLRHGYDEGEQPYIFFRDVPVADGINIRVEVDFLAAEYGGTGRGHRTQRFDDARPRKARGCGLAPFLVMKAIALNGRLKPKDAWDIYFVISKYEGGVEAIAELFRPLLSNSLVKEAIAWDDNYLG